MTVVRKALGMGVPQGSTTTDLLARVIYDSHARVSDSFISLEFHREHHCLRLGVDLGNVLRNGSRPGAARGRTSRPSPSLSTTVDGRLGDAPNDGKLSADAVIEGSQLRRLSEGVCRREEGRQARDESFLRAILLERGTERGRGRRATDCGSSFGSM